MTGTQVCTRCDVEKPFDQFSWKNKKKGIRHSQCKRCHAIYRCEHYLNNQDKYIDKARRWDEENKAKHLEKLRRYVLEYLLKHPCVDCGESNPIVLDFDHVRGEKKLPISVMMGSVFSLEMVITEIEKCDVRCANCHRRKTAKEQGWQLLNLMAEYGLDS